MAKAPIKSINLLPEFLRTDKNSKFLSSTLDQWIQPPALERIDDYIGSTITPTYNPSTDNYLTETLPLRQNYQLEPAVVVKSPQGDIKSAIGFDDLVNEISTKGGLTNNLDRLFKSDFYSYDPQIDLDKLVNYTQYYWLTTGPNTVVITGQPTNTTSTYTVTDNELNSAFVFTPNGIVENPIVTLYRGNTYNFEVNSQHKFYIKTDSSAGSSGAVTSNVTNNGATTGIVTLVVDEFTPETLFYIAEDQPEALGQFVIKDSSQNSFIDVEQDILGKKEYRSGTGVQLSNGMKVRFGGTVTPAEYQNKEYWVEGVGSHIKLIDYSLLTSSESMASQFDEDFDATPFDEYPFDNFKTLPITPEYITINRASKDLNPWSRYNRWVHADVIKASAEAAGQTPSYSVNLRAQRPIIEFKADLKLFNFGTEGIKNIDLIDTVTIDAFSTVEGSAGYYVDGVLLQQGHRVIFNADTDITVRGKIYEVNYLTVNGYRTRLQLVPAEDFNIKLGHSVGVNDGTVGKGSTWWYNGSNWLYAQQHDTLNQPPLFDLFDKNGNSYSDTTAYQSSFAGTKVFGYDVGTGKNDTVLGFPLKYKNSVGVGSYLFKNYFTTDKISVSINNAETITILTSETFLKFSKPLGDQFVNVWTSAKEYIIPILQFQTISDATNKVEITAIENPTTNKFTIDVLVDNTKLDSSKYSITTRYNKSFITFNTTLTVNSTVLFKIYTNASVTQTGHYEIPLGLSNNPLNGPISSFTLSELSDHLETAVTRLPGFVGTFPGSSNLRNINDVATYGTRLISNANPMAFAHMFLGKKEHSVIDAIGTVSDQYNLFKMSFLNKMLSVQVQDDPVLAVDLILADLNQNKNPQSSYYKSDMTGYGNDKTTKEWTVGISKNATYPLSAEFDPTTLSERSVLVYLNGKQLIVGKDYEFSTTDAELTILTDLSVGDKILINDYSSTVGSYIPPTPSKLGLYPKFEPLFYQDDTYAIPVNVIQCHDGSILLAYNDFRDDIIIELERRIYNNIKTLYRPELFDVNSVIPGAFRNTEYSPEEINNILTTEFIRWAGFYGIEYSTNTTFDETNPFTWNYTGSVNKELNITLNGNWRSVYKYFYDTDRPHVAPWEMLGFPKQPVWWESEYGPAPYTSGNEILWDDLEKGVIRDPAGIVTNALYARPGLGNLIPVDDQGNLVDPLANIASEYTTYSRRQNWKIGDFGPAETAWRRSSYWPFVLQRILALTKPASYASLMYDPANMIKNIAGQWTHGTNSDFLNPKFSRIFNGSTLTSGYSVYLVEAGKQRNSVYATELAEDLTYFDVNLFHKVGGFVNKNNIQIVIDAYDPTSTGPGALLPQENYSLYLNTSNPVSSIGISGLIIQKSGAKFIVKGYDKFHPYFNVYTPVRNSSTPSMTVGGISSPYVVWVAGGDTGGNLGLTNEDVTTAKSTAVGKFYQKGQIVSYGNRYYIVTTSHLAENVFNSALYQSLPSLPMSGGASVQTYSRFDKTVSKISYGTEFANIQEVYDFIVGYGAWLTDQGFIFDQFNNTLGAVLDWNFTAKEFLYWTTQNWADNSIIALSPFADQLKFKFKNSVVDNIFDSFYDYNILKENGLHFPQKSLSVNRDEGVCTIKTISTTEGIYFAQLNSVQKEHAMVFDNTTVFNDTIYDIETGYRQRRVRLIGFRTANWDGDYFTPGFVYDTAAIANWTEYTDYLYGEVVRFNSKYYSAIQDVPGTAKFDFTKWAVLGKKPVADLIPNFEYKINQFEDFYSLDIDNFDSNQQELAQHLIGYTPRVYLNNIFINPIAQYKFYQGFIREKGTKNAITKLSKASIQNLQGTISFNEEWAFRIGNYGSYETYREIEATLHEGNFVGNPQIVSFVDTKPDLPNDLIVYNTPDELAIIPTDYQSRNTFITTSSQNFQLETAGYVNINDVTATAYNETSLLDISNTRTLNEGDYIWLASKENGNWDIYRYQRSAAGLVGANVITPGSEVEFITDELHNLSVGDIISVSQYDAQVNGVHKITSIPSPYSFVIASTLDYISTFIADTPGALFTFDSARYASFDKIPSDQELFKLPTGVKVWIDNDPTKNWAVYEKIDNYGINRSTTSTSGSSYGSAIYKNNGESIIIEAAPGYSSASRFDVGTVFVKNIDRDGYILNFNLNQNSYQQYYNYSADYPAEFGTSIVYDSTEFNSTNFGLFYTGAPGASYTKSSSSLGGLRVSTGAVGETTSTYTNEGAVKISSVDPILFTEDSQHVLLSPAPATNQRFGQSIFVETRNVSSKCLLVGAPGVNSTSTGCVYSYTVDLSTTTDITFNSAILSPINGTGVQWGYSMSGTADCSTVVISGPGLDKQTGFIAVLSSDLTVSQTITGADVGFERNSRFGDTVLMSDDGQYIIVTAPGSVNGDNSKGAVAVFKSVNGSFTLTQTIINPVSGVGMMFGADVDINLTSDKLVISALGTDKFGRKFDTKLTDTTTFDSKTTMFDDLIVKSGCVYVYDRYNERFVFAQEINPGNLTTSTNFGQSIVVDSNDIYIGSPNTNIFANNETDYSIIYRYSKIDETTNSWSLLHSFDQLTEPESIQKVSLIDTFNESIVEYLDIVDPVKGKIAGIADQEVKFKSSIDPAVYTIGNANTVNDQASNWLDEHVGELWWDLSTVKYMWYEQGDLTYRKNNWGRLFPGSSIDVYEWVSSSYLPSEWAAIADTPAGLAQGISGQPKFPDNTVASVKQRYDSMTDSFVNQYYFWVKNKVTVPTTKNRRISANQTALIIQDPTNQGLKYAGIISSDSVIFANVSNELVGSRINVNIAHDIINNTVPKHTEWLLLQENSATSRPNALLEKKLLDSLLGHDQNGTPVPDPSLSQRTRYGIGIRPQQTLFKDRLAALRNLIEFSNSVLKENVISDQYNFANLVAQEDIPDEYTHSYDRIVEDNETLSVIDTRKLVQASLSCTVYNGKIVKVNIDNSGFGYLVSPTVKVIGDSDVTAIITTEIDNEGKVIKAIITNAGSGYSTVPLLEVRQFTVIVQADSIYNGKWSKFIWRTDLNNWVRSHTQKYNTRLYWNYIDWTSADYNQYQDYTYTIDEVYQLYTLTSVPVGQYIKVKNSGNGNFIILRKLEESVSGTFGTGYDLVYKQNGTIQISDAIWSKTNTIYGFDQLASYDQTLFDQTPDLELDYILKALKNDIFINELKINWNLFFFKAVKYALTEQKLLDWAFKTSFINVINNAGTLDQRPVYRLQNTQYFEDYIAEVKPYHSQIRGFTTQYNTSEQSNSFTSDFDLPSYFNQTTGAFESVESNATLLNTYPWKAWKDNKTFTVGSIAVGNPGAGYTTAPVVEITAQPGDLGSGAKAVAYIRSGSVISIEVTNSGQGYMKPPVVTIKGGGSTSLTRATAYAQLFNGKVRTNKVGMKFDRINRYNQIGQTDTTDSFICNGIQNEFVLSWLAEPSKATITTTLDKVRVLGADYTIKYYTEEYNGYKKKYCKIVFLNYIPKINQVLTVSYKKSKDLFTALERIESYYAPTSGMPGVAPAQLMDGMEYGRTQIRGLGFTATSHWDVLFGASTYSGFGNSSYADDISEYRTINLASTATAGTSTVVVNTTTGLKPGQYANIISNIVNEFNTSTVFIKSVNTASFKVTFTSPLVNTLTNATFEIWSYDPNSTSLDSVIDGGDLSYTSALGINPEDIIVDGDGFYTPNTSFGPEELLDGQVTESIGINVYTKNPNGAPLIFTSSFDIQADTTVTQSLSVLPTTINSISVNFNNAIYDYNSTTNFSSWDQFSIDWANQSLILPPQNVAGKVSYTILGVGGGNPNSVAGVIDYQKFSTYNEPRAELVSLSGVNTVKSAYVTVNGQPVTENAPTGLSYTLGPASKGSLRAAVTITNLPTYSTIQAWFFGSEVSYYNQVQEQVISVGEEPTSTFTLTRLPGTIEPADAQVIVEINDGAGRRQLLPPYVSYYQVADVNDRVFTIDNHVVRAPSTYTIQNVRVYKNGKTLSPGFDFSVNINDNTVTVYPNILEVDDVIAVLGLVPENYDYDIIGNILHVPLRSGLGVSGAEIKVITFTDQDGMLMRTERFPGNANKRYQISRPVINLNYLWVSVNGIPLKSNIDFDVLDDQVTVQLSDNFITDSSDTVVITSISSTKLASTILGYRIFIDMLGRTHYKRLSKENTTYLLTPLAHGDTEIHVADASILTPPLLAQKRPGVILVDGERIEFLEIDGNTLRKLRRGTLGTSPAFYSDINTKVIDQSPAQTIPYSEDVLKQVQFTSASTDTYIISTSQITTNTSFSTSTNVTSNGITLYNSMPAMDQIAVYYGGRQLRKFGTFYHDTTVSYDSPSGNVIGNVANSYDLPITTTIGNSYIVTATNQVWVYTGSASVDAVNGYVYQGMTYLEPEFSINTSTHSLMLNMSEAVQDDIELVIMQKQFNQASEWTNTGISLMDSTTAPARFLQQKPAELPDSWYYGGDITLTAGSGIPLTDIDQEPLQGL